MCGNREDSECMARGVVSSLQHQFQDTDWTMFASQATLGLHTDLNTSSFLDHIITCIDNVTTLKHVKTFPNQKPWMNYEVQLLLKAFRVGDAEAHSTARAKLKRDIRKAKSSYKLGIEEHFHNNSDSRSMWKGIQIFTDHIPIPPALSTSSAILPAEFNHNACFDQGCRQHTGDHPTFDHPFSLATTDVHSALSMVDFWMVHSEFPNL